MDVIFNYPGWLYLVLYSLPTFTWLVAALVMQIFTTKCLMLASNLNKGVDPSKFKLQDRKIELTTYWIMVAVAIIYLIAYIVSVANDSAYIGYNNRVIITFCYCVVMCVTLVSSVSFLCILKAKYGNKFL